LACENAASGCLSWDSVNEVSLALVDDGEISVLNKRYRGKEGATDVLSFSQQEGCELMSPNSNLGDVVISVDTLLRQAKRFKVPPEMELLRLVIHGLLHLAGYEHVGVPAARGRLMRKMEHLLLKRYAMLLGSGSAIRSAGAG